jgi:hypothetical protein
MMRPHLGLSLNKYFQQPANRQCNEDYARATDAHFRPDKPRGATGRSLIVLNPQLTVNQPPHDFAGSSPASPTNKVLTLLYISSAKSFER